MKTSHFSENLDLCHPQLGSERSNNNLTTNSNFSSDFAPKHELLAPSATVNYSTSSTSSSSTAIASTYGSNSSEPSKYEKNASELLVKNQQRQQQQQEQNKKRKRETGE